MMTQLNALVAALSLLSCWAAVNALRSQQGPHNAVTSLSRGLSPAHDALAKRAEDEFLVGVQNYHGSWVVAVPVSETDPCLVANGTWPHAGEHSAGKLHGCVSFLPIDGWVYTVCNGDKVYGLDGKMYGLCEHTSDRYDCRNEGGSVTTNFEAFARCIFGKDPLM